MPKVDLTAADLAPFVDLEPERASALVRLVLASARRVAPCLADDGLSAELGEAARSVLVQVALRWHDQREGGVTTTVTTGPMTATTTPAQAVARRSGGLLQPSDIEELQAICAEHSGASAGARAYGVDTAPGGLGGVHLPWCDVYFLGPRCSCGAALTGGVPIYEGGVDAADL